MDRIWGIWGSYYNIPKAIFYLLKGDYRWLRGLGVEGLTLNPKLESFGLTILKVALKVEGTEFQGAEGVRWAWGFRV